MQRALEFSQNSKSPHQCNSLPQDTTVGPNRLRNDELARHSTQVDRQRKELGVGTAILARIGLGTQVSATGANRIHEDHDRLRLRVLQSLCFDIRTPHHIIRKNSSALSARVPAPPLNICVNSRCSMDSRLVNCFPCR